VGDANTITVGLNAEDTRLLLHEAQLAYRTEVNDLLLTALAIVLCKWTGQSSVCVELEGHGREDLNEGVNLSRTVGWFTTRYPICLTLEEGGIGSTIKSLKEQVRRIPHKGFGYGVLRYLHQEAVIRDSMRPKNPAWVTFNYLGQLDGAVEEASLFR